MTATAAPAAQLTPRPNHRSSAGRTPARPRRHDRRRKYRRSPAAVPIFAPEIALAHPADHNLHRRVTDHTPFDRPTATAQIPIDRAHHQALVRRPARSFPGGLRTPAAVTTPTPPPAGIHNPSQTPKLGKSEKKATDSMFFPAVERGRRSRAFLTWIPVAAMILAI